MALQQGPLLIKSGFETLRLGSTGGSFRLPLKPGMVRGSGELLRCCAGPAGCLRPCGIKLMAEAFVWTWELREGGLAQEGSERRASWS